ncbi:MAG: hypothetical protein ABI488_03770 [Polyangiaceae bacterium]
MTKKSVGALVLGMLGTFVASACNNPVRNFGSANGGAEQSAAGTAGTGPDERGGSAGNQASGGNRAGGGAGGTGGTQASAGAAGAQVAGGSSVEAGAGGEGEACQGSDCASCVGATPALGAQCGECGTYACNPDHLTTSCSDPKHNACGGCAALTAAPGSDCGGCGKYECAADNESVTCKDPGKNACAGCGVLANAPNSSCGACGNWQCTADKSGVQCSGLNANACGGCGALANAPGVACGQCGKYACSTDKASTTCADPGKNACGGCGVLTGTLNAACGSGNCGKLLCSADKNSLTCSGSTPNACGGCSALTPAGATKDGSCGSCGRVYACNADLNSLSCAGTLPNACGGCTAITGTVGASCGTCGKLACASGKNSLTCSGDTPNACGGCTALAGTVGASCGACSVTACAANKNSLNCNSQCSGAQVCVSGLNQCKTADCSAANSCGMSDGAGSTCTGANGKCLAKPNAAGSCSGSSCVYACNGSYYAKTLSCSTPAQPACGSWNFESGGTEGWYVNTADANNVAKGNVYAATPPGAGGGAHSLALQIDGSGAAYGHATISLNFCPGSAEATGIQGALHVSVWFQPTDSNGGPGGPGYTYLNDGNGGGSIGGEDTYVPANTWTDIPSYTVSGGSVAHADVTVDGLGGHKGTLYFDNIHFD